MMAPSVSLRTRPFFHGLTWETIKPPGEVLLLQSRFRVISARAHA